MNLLFSCVGKWGYIADFFRPHLLAGDRIVGTGNTSWTAGFQACDAAFVLPSIADEEYVGAVLELCERERIDAIFCVEDPDVYKLSQVRDEFLSRGIVPLFPSAEIADVTYDKYRAFKFLDGHGIPTPRTALSPAEAEGFGYPLYVKPRHGSGSQNTFLARDERELAFFFDYVPEAVVQERIDGQELNIQLCGDLEGHPVGMCVLRKHRMRHGETDQAETVRDAAAIDLGLVLGEILRATGPVDIDVFQQGDALVVLEVNARFGGGYPASHLAGADFPRLLCELVRHGKVSKPSFEFTPGVAMMKRLGVVGGPALRFFRDQLHLHEGQG